MATYLASSGVSLVKDSDLLVATAYIRALALMADCASLFDLRMRSLSGGGILLLLLEEDEDELPDCEEDFASLGSTIVTTFFCAPG